MPSQHWRWPGLGASLPEAPPPRFEPRMEAVRQNRRRPPGAVPVHKEAAASSDLTGVAPQPAAAAPQPAAASQPASEAALCMHTGCAFLCTGLSLKHCCRKCAHHPGSHGPKCEKKLQPCGTEGCGYAVTGLTATHCCHRCRQNGSSSQSDEWGSHGPHCWRLSAAGSDGSKAAACASGAPAAVVAAPTQPASTMSPSSAQLEANRAAIAANAARIQALYAELENDLQKAM